MVSRVGLPIPGSPWRVNAVAVACDCTGAHVYDQCNDGTLPHFRLGGMVLVPDPVMRERLQLTDEQHQALREAIATQLAAEGAEGRAKSRRGVNRRTQRRCKSAEEETAPPSTPPGA